MTTPKLVQFEGGASEEGSTVLFKGRLSDGGPLAFAIDSDKVSWVMAKLMEWQRDAAEKAGWRREPISGQDDSGVWLKPTQVGFVDAGSPNSVMLVFDVGPTRLRFELDSTNARKLCDSLVTAATPKTQPH